ncbi:MAG: hypothetical protein GYB36_10815 [Alphaproteobacteria bacterium]|nr:hypothetical protein [Alphaproteobacteria bacterium]
MAKLLLIGNHRPSFAVARALHREGHEIWAGSNEYSDYFELSNAVRGHLPLPDFDREAECIAVIEAHLRDHGFDALWPVTDRATRMVAKHRVRLVRHARIVSPPPGLIKTCVSKTAMATLCAELNVPVAPQTPVASREQIRKAGRSLGYPLVIKPTGEGEFIFGHKVITLKAESDLDSLFPEWPDNHVHLLVQQRLNGLRHNHYFVARDGVLLRGAAIEILRTDREDGSGYAVEGISSAPRADLAEQTAKLVHALGYTGIGCAQYMTSEDSQATSFLEINPRLGANIAAAEITGADLVGQAFRLAFGKDVEVLADPWSAARTGLRYAWSKGDLSGLAWRYRQGAGIEQTLWDLGRLISSGVKADTHLVFDWHDPLPALACWAHPLIKRFSPEMRPSPGTSIKAR